MKITGYSSIVSVGLFLFALNAFAQVQGNYTNSKGPCDPKFGNDGNLVMIRSGNHSWAGTSSDQIFLCIGEHKRTYTTTSPKIERFEYRHFDDDPSSGTHDAGCFQLSTLDGRSRPLHGSWSNWQSGIRMNKRQHEYQFAYCSNEMWDGFFRYLEPDSMRNFRLYTESADGLEITGLKIIQNRVRIYEENNMEAWLDRYQYRQIDLSWRIAQYKHNKIASKITTYRTNSALEWDDPNNWSVGSGHGFMPSTLEVAAQDLGYSGARKYNRQPVAWCSEFAAYVIENGAHLSNSCPGYPDGLLEGDFSIQTIHDWLDGCNRVTESVKNKPWLIRPGYYLSIGWDANQHKGHSVIFVGWADGDHDGSIDPGEWYWEISGNNQCETDREVYGATWKSNMACVALRNWNDLNDDDFAGTTN